MIGEYYSIVYSTQTRQVNENRLVTPQGGEVILDQLLLEIWKKAMGCSLEELSAALPGAIIRRLGHDPSASKLDVVLAVACLAEAGLLSRNLPEEITPIREQQATSRQPRTEKSLVSVIIVSYNSKEWLTECLDSLQKQSYRPLEILIVDNASTDGSADWLKSAVSGLAVGKQVSIPDFVRQAIYLESPVSLATAINLGIRKARGDFYFILNPDTRLDAQSVAVLVEALQEPTDEFCLPDEVGPPQSPVAAAAAKLKLMWTPGFLNGLGNFVGAISWGIDIGLGHLDLGQFDHWKALPSACFAAAMIPASAWKAIGPLDENLPMYYEDSEWCYRARLLGWQIAAVPQAVVYHALGGRTSNVQNQDRNPAKQQRVVYGRLHFITRLLGTGSWLRFWASYFAEDFARWTLALLKRQAGLRRSICAGWRQFLKAYPRLRQENRYIRKSRAISDRQLLKRQVSADRNIPIPPPLVHQGIPLLTWEIVRSIYGPYLMGAVESSRPVLPELAWARSHFSPEELQVRKPGLLRRAVMIYHLEGKHTLIERIAKGIQHALR
jgi:GT2 family glycosyltransferase